MRRGGQPVSLMWLILQSTIWLSAERVSNLLLELEFTHLVYSHSNALRLEGTFTDGTGPAFWRQIGDEEAPRWDDLASSSQAEVSGNTYTGCLRYPLSRTKIVDMTKMKGKWTWNQVYEGSRQTRALTKPRSSKFFSRRPLVASEAASVKQLRSDLTFPRGSRLPFS